MGFDDELDADEPPYRAPLPPDDRVWRHPSELARSVAPARPDRAPAWIVGLISGVTGALLATAVAVVAGGWRDSPTTIERVVERQAVTLPAAGGGPTTVAQVAEQVRPAIVELVVDRNQGRSTGSGVIFRDDGHILTNNHVVEGATTVTVISSDGRRTDGRVLGGDPETDIAVVKAAGGPYRPAVLGTATGLREGDGCIAIGSPLGLAGGPSVSVGVVSALGRSLPVEGGRRLYDMIQTDAAISPGSSGGALLDMRGAVIGITTAIAVTEAGAEGLGFATPIDIARSVADELMTTGRATHVWLGIEGADLDVETMRRLGLTGGAAVMEVAPGSPAAKAGLRAGDVIVAVDGRRVATMAALVVALRRHRVGDAVEIAYVRDGAARTAAARLGERPAKGG
jgi:S1-C subfamily serine protease